MAYQFTRPNVYNAATAQQAYDEAHAYATYLIGCLNARHAGAAHRKTMDWGAAGSVQHLIDLLEEALDASTVKA